MPKTIGPIEFIWENERLSVRYSKGFRRKSAIILLIITVVAAGLLAFPVSAIARGRFLEVITIAVFLLIMGGVAGVWAVTGWMHLVAHGWRPIVVDRQSGTCSIPSGFFGRRLLRVADIERVRVERKRLVPGMYRNLQHSPQMWSTHNIDRDRIVLLLKNGKTEQRLWGQLGIPREAEAVAREIAACLACRFERRPARYFNHESQRAD
jgi:hypothetical protein